jgi:hypothetical protein
MTNRIEEITSFAPLSKGREFRLRLLKYITHIIFCIWATASIAGVFYMYLKERGLIEWTIPHATIYILIGIAFNSGIVAFALTSQTKRAKILLELSNKAMVYFLVPKSSQARVGRRYYDTFDVVPCPIDEARHQVEKHQSAIVAFVLPLKRNQAAEIYVRQDGKGLEPITLTEMRLSLLYVCDQQHPRVLLSDNKTMSAIEMSVTTALERIYENRFRIMASDINFLWVVSEELMTDAERKIAELTETHDQCEADRSTLCSAIADAATALSNYERLFRSWGPVCEVGMMLVRTTGACPSRNEVERARIEVARAEFGKDRGKRREV